MYNRKRPACPKGHSNLSLSFCIKKVFDDYVSNLGASNKCKRLCGVNLCYKFFIKLPVFWKIQIIFCININLRQATSTRLPFM